MAARGICAFFLAVAASAPGQGAQYRSMPLPPEPEPRTGTVPLSPGERVSAAVLERALRADAARTWQLGDGGASLSVRIEPVRWRDGALGCPLPDRLYTQAAVDGWRVVVSDGTRQLHYHVSADGRWMSCPADRVQPPMAEPLVR